MRSGKDCQSSTWACESEKGISSENVTEEVPGSEASPLRQGSGGHSRPPEAYSSEMLSEPHREAALCNEMNGDESQINTNLQIFVTSKLSWVCGLGY